MDDHLTLETVASSFVFIASIVSKANPTEFFPTAFTLNMKTASILFDERAAIRTRLSHEKFV